MANPLQKIFTLGMDPRKVFGTDASKNDAAARDAMNAALKQFDINTPDLQQYTPDQYSYLGDVAPQTIQPGADVQYSNVNPSLVNANNVQGSALEGIQTDPRLQNDQMAALNALKAISEGGGLTAADQANLNRVQNEAAQSDRGRREAIMQNMQQRGMSGGGQSLLAQLQSNQAATDRANQAGLDIAGMAQQRALDAIMQSGSLAGNMQNQAYNQQANLAAAKDAIAKFNAQNTNSAGMANMQALNNAAMANAANQYQAATGNRAANLGAQQFNISALNAANAANVDARQNVANANVGLNNQAKQYNQALPQQQFNNQVNLGQQKANALQGQANYQNSLSDRKAKKESQLLGALGDIASTAATQGMK